MIEKKNMKTFIFMVYSFFSMSDEYRRRHLLSSQHGNPHLILIIFHQK